jgi:hypothetical protein
MSFIHNYSIGYCYNMMLELKEDPIDVMDTTWKVNNYAGSRSRSDQAGMSNSKTSSQDFPSVKYRLLSSNRERSTSRPIARHF